MRALGALLGAAALALVSTPVAGAEVPWRWWDGALHQLTHGLADPPGINDDTCRSEGRDPVILVHGTGLNGGNSWATFGAALRQEGYCVWAPTIGAPPAPGGGAGSVGGIDSLTGASAPQLVAEIDRVLAVSGADRVDLVGHSQGAVAAGYVSAVSRGARIGRLVTLGVDPSRFGEGPPAVVTDVLGVLSAETSRRDAEATAAWRGADGIPFSRGVHHVAVVSDADELTGRVEPWDVPPGIDLDLVRLQDGCPADRSGHLTVLASPRAVDLVVDALGGGGDRAPRCVPADGITGVLGPGPER